jgi:macrolide-specific efflux system membrane fusion protein
MTIQAQISEADVPRVHPGMPAYFTILGEPDHKYPAMLSKIEPGPIDMKTYDGTANSSTAATAVYYNGLLNASNPDGKLRIEMTAQVSIVLSQARNALLIPSGALIQRSASKRSASAASGASATNAPAASAVSAAASVPEPASAAPDTAAQPPQQTASSASDSPGRGRLYMVRVAKGEKGKETIEERQVRIGLNNRVQAQVLEGLQEGERVVIGDASGAKAGSTRMPGVRMF